MLAESGQFALIVALAVALIQGTFPLLGAYRQNASLMALARPAALTQFFFTALSFACLAALFLNNDFTVAYVASHSNSQLPEWFKVSAVWGGHEGSLLLWVLILAGWSAAVAVFSKDLPQDMVSRVLSIMGLLSVGFMLFILLTSNPFDRLLPSFPFDGSDLNPLLQDIGLIIHPPLLYMGYVGFSVVFAFAIAGLISGRLDSTWAKWSRPWTLIAWCFLTVGIALGSWWAYYELGWGGWWFWDPVENASLMPWLAGTALLHALAVTEKRKIFKAWTIMLAITSFSLSLLGTFLVRSGVLTSVHAFASDPERGMFVLGFLIVVVGGSLSLFAFRVNLFKGQGQYQLFSRETLLMLGNILLLVATVVVLLGTLFPLISEAFNMGKISVGPPYFNLLFFPLTLLAMLLMGVAPFVRWKKQEAAGFIKGFVWMAVISVVLGIAFPWIFFGSPVWQVIVVTVFCVWVLSATIKDVVKKSVNKKNVLQGFISLPRSYKGMMLGHLGIVVLVMGVTYTSFYSTEIDVRMATGDSVSIKTYSFKFHGVKDVSRQNHNAVMGEIEVSQNGKRLFSLYPEKRVYAVQKNMMTEAAIHWNLGRDIYVALGDSFDDGSWAVRVQHKPLMRLVWLGALISALGGILVVADRRYRQVRRKRSVKNSPLELEA